MTNTSITPSIISPDAPDISTTPLRKTPAIPAGAEQWTGRTGGFKDALEAQAALNNPAIAQAAREQTPEELKKQAEKAAAGLVSNALILPILQQIRRSPWGKDTVFSPGKAEKAFGPQFDMEIADRIASSPRLGVKQALAAKLLKRTNVTPAQTGIDVHG